MDGVVKRAVTRGFVMWPPLDQHSFDGPLDDPFPRRRRDARITCMWLPAVMQELNPVVYHLTCADREIQQEVPSKVADRSELDENCADACEHANVEGLDHVRPTCSRPSESASSQTQAPTEPFAILNPSLERPVRKETPDSPRSGLRAPTGRHPGSTSNRNSRR